MPQKSKPIVFKLNSTLIILIALFCSTSLFSQVVRISVNYLGEALDVLPVDMDGDGVVDFNIESTNYANFTVLGRDLAINTFNQTMLRTGSFEYVPVSNIGDLVDSNLDWVDYTTQPSLAGYVYLYAFNTHFGAYRTNAYFAIQFRINGNIHYGWLRMVIFDGTHWVVLEYAYEQTPNVGLTIDPCIPLTVLRTQSNVLNDIDVVVNIDEIIINNLNEFSNYKLYSIDGKTVLEGVVEQNSNIIKTSRLASGIYILKIEEEFSGKIFSQKIVKE